MIFPEFCFLKKCGFVKPKIIYIYLMTWTESRGKGKAEKNPQLLSKNSIVPCRSLFQQFFRLRCTGRPPLQTWFSFLSPIHLSCQAVVKHLLAVVKIVQPCRLKGFSVLFTFKWFSKGVFFKKWFRAKSMFSMIF